MSNDQQRMCVSPDANHTRAHALLSRASQFLLCLALVGTSRNPGDHHRPDELSAVHEQNSHRRWHEPEVQYLCGDPKAGPHR